MKKLKLIVILALTLLVCVPSHAQTLESPTKTERTPNTEYVTEEINGEMSSEEEDTIFKGFKDAVFMSDEEKAERNKELNRPLSDQAEDFAVDLFIDNIPFIVIFGVLLVILVLYQRKSNKMGKD